MHLVLHSVDPFRPDLGRRETQKLKGSLQLGSPNILYYLGLSVIIFKTVSNYT